MRRARTNTICCIYKITSPSRKIYIGQTTDYENRMRFYRRADCKKQSKLYHSLKKYGIKKHKFEIIHRCEPHELNSLEIYYIELYNCIGKESGLNLREGGGAQGKLSEETKRKLSENRMGEKHHNYGKKLSDEHKLKISIGGRGRKLSPEHIAQIRLANKGKKLSQWQKDQISKFHKGRTGLLCHNSVPILQYDLTGVLIKEWSCGQDAARELNLNQRNISTVCNKKRLTAGGFYWSFKETPLMEFPKKGDKKKKPLIQLSKSGEFIAEWDSAKSVEEGLGLDQRNIGTCLRGTTSSAYGFIWKYKTAHQ